MNANQEIRYCKRGKLRMKNEARQSRQCRNNLYAYLQILLAVRTRDDYASRRFRRFR